LASFTGVAAAACAPVEDCVVSGAVVVDAAAAVEAAGAGASGAPKEAMLVGKDAIALFKAVLPFGEVIGYRLSSSFDTRDGVLACAAEICCTKNFGNEPPMLNLKRYDTRQAPKNSFSGSFG
jgi:hypothetical protein